MTKATPSVNLLIITFIFFGIVGMTKGIEPVPTTWPDQFHSVGVLNNSGIVQLNDLWYDWTNGRNFNIIQLQLGNLLYDLEWNNGMEAHVMTFEVGAVLEDEKWQVPCYCFKETNSVTKMNGHQVDGVIICIEVWLILIVVCSVIS
ncbi:uncharacterized protein At4g14100-like [Rutidosis leptorrhynchoides]|uniref:uncharacterized protein At4g14100-like n=1 Tax=Rutidosis leptorrhynchoides TaxID=125765 RepID=UPI003A98D9B3